MTHLQAIPARFCVLGLAGDYSISCSVHMPLKMDYIFSSSGFVKRMVLFAQFDELDPNKPFVISY